MNSILIFLVIWIPIFVIACSTFLIIKRNQLLESEKSMHLLHKITCGGKFNYGLFTLRLSHPFVQVRMYKHFIVISHIKKIKLEYSEIAATHQGFHGVVIEHNDKEYPVGMILKTANAKDLEERLTTVI